MYGISFLTVTFRSEDPVYQYEIAPFVTFFRVDIDLLRLSIFPQVGLLYMK